MTPDTQPGTILVVEDNADIREFVEEFLGTAGYTIITAADGEEGLRLFQAHQSSIVLLLTDVLMPKMDGFELADRVRRIDSQLRILFMSGDRWCTYRDVECIAKPFQGAELVEKVRRALNGNVYSGRASSAA